MHTGMKILMAVLVLAVLVSTGYLVLSALEASGAGHGLVRYFARLGIGVDLRAVILAVGLIPLAWLVGFIIRTWSVK
ncbi:MAG TPA: hypothetical protein PLV84_07255 [Deltaproteobacteria bacterium]|nr:hypothetical protein [Deltaproteobacteria bacterium]